MKGVYRVPGEGTLFMIGLKLKNISDSNIDFLAMNCATIINVVFDSNQLVPVVNNCASNYPIPIVMNPQQEFDFTFLLKASGLFPDRLKIGWVLLSKQNTPSINQYHDNLDKFRAKLENVLWADPIYLTVVGFNQFEIK